MAVISFVSSKGGVGKTTSAVVLAGELVAAGRKVALIYADPNRPLVAWSQLRPVPESLRLIVDDSAETIIDTIEDARAEERRRTEAVQEIANEAQSKLDQALADAGAARSAGERLRDRIAQLTAACRAAASNPDAANAGAPAEVPADLLADVQRRLDEAADGIAGFADKSSAAGKACERSYDALTTRPAGGLGLKR